MQKVGRGDAQDVSAALPTQSSQPLTNHGLTIASSLKTGGAGESRTRDTQFRKLLLYPSELQPHIYKSLIEHRLAQGYPLASVDALHRRCTLAVNAFAYRREPKPEPK